MLLLVSGFHFSALSWILIFFTLIFPLSLSYCGVMNTDIN